LEKYAERAGKSASIRLASACVAFFFVSSHGGSSGDSGSGGGSFICGSSSKPFLNDTLPF